MSLDTEARDKGHLWQKFPRSSRGDRFRHNLRSSRRVADDPAKHKGNMMNDATLMLERLRIEEARISKFLKKKPKTKEEEDKLVQAFINGLEKFLTK